jgi:hypothetical protein
MSRKIVDVLGIFIAVLVVCSIFASPAIGQNHSVRLSENLSLYHRDVITLKANDGTFVKRFYSLKGHSALMSYKREPDDASYFTVEVIGPRKIRLIANNGYYCKRFYDWKGMSFITMDRPVAGKNSEFLVDSKGGNKITLKANNGQFLKRYYGYEGKSVITAYKSEEDPSSIFRVNRVPIAELGEQDVRETIAKFGPLIYFRSDERYLMDDPEYVLDNGVSLESGIVEMEDKYDSFQLNRVRSLITSNKTLMDDVRKVEKLSKDSPDSEKYKYWLSIDDSMKPGNLNRAKALVRVLPALHAMHTEIQFWFFYPFNGPGRVEVCASSNMCDDNWLKEVGRHYGDWEHISLLVSNATPPQLISVYMSRHSDGEKFSTVGRGLVFRSSTNPERILEFHDSHPVIYSAMSSHAHYASAGNHSYKRVYSREWGWPFKMGTASADLFDRTAGERLFRTYSRYRIISSDLPNFKVSEPDWLEFKGRWGQHEKLKDNIKFSDAKIEVWRYEEVGKGPVGPKQHKESWYKGDFHP